MNDRDKNRRTKFLVGAVAALTLATHSTFATNGSWNADSDGNWSDATKWLGGNIADGAGATANFTFNITGSRTITLDSARTVGIVNIGGIPEIATALGVADCTIRTHVGRLFDKTGTGRQADLVKLVAGFFTPLVA